MTTPASPPYSPPDGRLSRTSSTSTSLLDSPPPYEEAAAAAAAATTAAAAALSGPTVHFQIETQGKPWLSLPLPPRPDPIPIFSLEPGEKRSSASAVSHTTPKFICVRPDRSSGSCYLTYGGHPSSSSSSTTPSAIPLSTTTYRFGPNRPPRIRLFLPGSFPAPLPPSALLRTVQSYEDDEDDPAAAAAPVAAAWDDFTVRSAGLFTRAVEFRTRLGTFRWRYGTRGERRAYRHRHHHHHHHHHQQESGAAAAAQIRDETGDRIDSLLILERVCGGGTTTGGGEREGGGGGGGGGEQRRRREGSARDKEIRTPVAYLLRSDAHRAAGSRASSAGNGGRLVVVVASGPDNTHAGHADTDRDGGGPEGGLGPFRDDKKEKKMMMMMMRKRGEEGEVDEGEMLVVMAVTTCLVMLKREVDRRRAQQMAMIAGAAGGGG